MVQGVDSTGNTQITTHIYHGRFIVLPKNPPRTTYKEYWSYPHNIKKEHD